MVICQWLVGPNYLVKIGIHEIINKVDIFEVLSLWWPNYVFTPDKLLKKKNTRFRCWMKVVPETIRQHSMTH